MDVRAIPMLRRASPGFFSRIAGVLAVALCALAAGYASAQDDLPGRVGRVAELGGELFLAPQDKPDGWSPIGLNYPVTNGDNLWVGNDGRAEIDFGGGQFRLAGGTNLHVSRLDDRQFAIFVAQGIVSLRVRVLDPGESARIDTPNAQIAITRPGLYRVDVSEDREHSHLVVREGEANVQTLAAVQQVLPGQSADVDGTDPQYASVRNGTGNDGFDAWVASRDRRYQGTRTANYVSPQMVGAADLDQYGTWSQAPEYGAVWYPNDVAADWAPYRNGYWTDVGAWGPTWVDYAPWGYAPFHYGRWVYVRNRWGWTPGQYVARPLWAPALVGWAGGSGWSISATVGGPVYGWVPLAWGEPYRPWWGRCSYGCWDRYNKPYAVNVAVVRRDSPPPTRYANWNSPGGITAVSGAAFAARQPVAQNLVRVPRDVVASAPVMATAPAVRIDPSRSSMQRPVTAPPPASTFQPAIARTDRSPSTSPFPRSTPPDAANPGVPYRSAPPTTASQTPTLRQPQPAPMPQATPYAAPSQPMREANRAPAPPPQANTYAPPPQQPMRDANRAPVPPPQLNTYTPPPQQPMREANRAPSPPPQANTFAPPPPPSNQQAQRDYNRSRPQSAPVQPAQVQPPQAAPTRAPQPQPQAMPQPQPRAAPQPQVAAPPPPQQPRAAPQSQPSAPPGQDKDQGNRQDNRGGERGPR